MQSNFSVTDARRVVVPLISEGVRQQAGKMLDAARCLLDMGSTALQYAFEPLKHRIQQGAFVRDPAFLEKMQAQLTQANICAAQAGAAGFLGLFVASAVIGVAVTKIVQSYRQKPQELFALLRDGKINVAETKQALKRKDIDLSTPEGIEQARTQLVKLPFSQIVELCQDEKPECVKKLISFFGIGVGANSFPGQFDLIEPLLNKVAVVEGGKEVIQAFLDHLSKNQEDRNLLLVPELFKRVMAFVDALPQRGGKPYFSATDLKNILTARNQNMHRQRVPDAPKIFAEAMPWLERIADEPEGGRQMLIEILTLHSYYGQTPLHYLLNVPFAIQLLNRLQPPLTDAEWRSLLLVKEPVSLPDALFPSREEGTMTDNVPLYHVPLFLHVAPRLLRFIEANDQEMITFIKRFMQYAGDLTYETINLRDPAVFAVAKPLIEAMAKQKQLTLDDIEIMFTRCHVRRSGKLPLGRVKGTPPAPIFNLENLKWILSLTEQLGLDKGKVFEMLKRDRNSTDFTALHTPGALAIVKPYLPDLTLWEMLKVLFEAGSSMTVITKAKTLREEKFHPAEVTVFERNLVQAKKWIEESKPTDEEIQAINRCVEAWIALDSVKSEERREMVASWDLLKNKLNP